MNVPKLLHLHCDETRSCLLLTPTTGISALALHPGPIRRSRRGSRPPSVGPSRLSTPTDRGRIPPTPAKVHRATPQGGALPGPQNVRPVLVGLAQKDRKISAKPVLDGGFKVRYRGFAGSSGARDRSRFLCEGRFGGGVFPVCRDPGFVRA